MGNKSVYAGTHRPTQIRSTSDEDRILLCLVDSQGNVIIFLNKLSGIDAAIKNKSFAKFLNQDKIGQTCLFAFDESKRMLVVYASARVCSCDFRFI